MIKSHWARKDQMPYTKSILVISEMNLYHLGQMVASDWVCAEKQNLNISGIEYIVHVFDSYKMCETDFKLVFSFNKYCLCYTGQNYHNLVIEF